MQTLRRKVIISGTLLTALIAFTAYAEAKDLYSFQGSSSGPSLMAPIQFPSWLSAPMESSSAQPKTAGRPALARCSR